jgi:hypothetical protein
MRSATQLLRVKFIAATALVLLGTNAAAPARADEAVRAVWHVQDISFPYFGLTTHYSCDGLRDRVRSILKQLQVREDYLVSVGGCTEVTGPVWNPSVHMIIASAVPATDETTKAFAADPKRAELLARLQRKNKTPSSDAPFDAIARRVTLYAKDNAGPGVSGDCELLEHLHRFVLPKLGANVLRDGVSCTPHQGTVGNPSIEVELLVAAPVKS